jgi:hypothetical protein
MVVAPEFAFLLNVGGIQLESDLSKHNRDERKFDQVEVVGYSDLNSHAWPISSG